MLAFIGQGIKYKSWNVLLQLDKTLVRVNLEYRVQFTTLHEKCSGTQKSAEEIHQDFTWNGGLYKEKLYKMG